MIRVFFFFVFLSLNLHHLCVLVMRRKIPPIALFFHFVILEKSLQLLYTPTQNVMKGIDMRNSQFLEVLLFDMKLNLAKSWLSSLEALICAEKFRLGGPQGVMYLTSCTRQGQAKTWVKPVWCVTWGKTKIKPQTKPFLMFGKYFQEVLSFSSSPLLSPQPQVIGAHKTPSSGVLSLFQVGFCAVAFPPVCRQRYP